MDYKKLLDAVVDISRSAGSIIRSERNLIQSEDIEIKGKNSLVSYVDRKAEEHIVSELKKCLPNAGFLTEEETVSQALAEYNWIIDPLDGTTNFIHGVPVYAVSIALEHKGIIELGVVYEVSRDECFYALRNGGAFLNGKKMRVSQTKNMNDTLFATGFPYYDFSRMENFLTLLADCFQHTRGVRRLGSAATDLVYVAAGRFDGYFEYGLSPWDVAAGSLIATEAGAVVCDFSGKDQFLYGKEIIAVQPKIEKEFMEMLKKHMIVN